MPRKNPFLASTTAWAIHPTAIPWGSGGGMGGMNEFMYAAYVKELGTRLANLAPVLAKAAGTAKKKRKADEAAE